jgi:ribosomal protein L35
MKLKTHSGLKKRIKVKKSKGKVKLFYQKAARNHLLVNKSKKQKGLQTYVEADQTRVRAIRRLMPNI